VDESQSSSFRFDARLEQEVARRLGDEAVLIEIVAQQMADRVDARREIGRLVAEDHADDIDDEDAGEHPAWLAETGTALIGRLDVYVNGDAALHRRAARRTLAHLLLLQTWAARWCIAPAVLVARLEPPADEDAASIDAITEAAAAALFERIAGRPHVDESELGRTAAEVFRALPDEPVPWRLVAIAAEIDRIAVDAGLLSGLLVAIEAVEEVDAIVAAEGPEGDDDELSDIIGAFADTFAEIDEAFGLLLRVGLWDAVIGEVPDDPPNAQTALDDAQAVVVDTIGDLLDAAERELVVCALEMLADATAQPRARRPTSQSTRPVRRRPR